MQTASLGPQNRTPWFLVGVGYVLAPLEASPSLPGEPGMDTTRTQDNGGVQGPREGYCDDKLRRQLRFEAVGVMREVNAPLFVFLRILKWDPQVCCGKTDDVFVDSAASSCDSAHLERCARSNGWPMQAALRPFHASWRGWRTTTSNYVDTIQAGDIGR